MRKSLVLIIFLILALGISVVLFNLYQAENINANDPQTSETERVTKGNRVYQPPQSMEIQISGVGDIMVHSPQLTAQRNPKTNTYDFHNNFKYVAPYLQRADLMLGNLETTFRGDEVEYSGYPMFNTPDTLADALKKAGFDGLATANNHAFDTGVKGVVRTIEVLKDRDLAFFGTRSNEEEEGFSIIDVKGIKVGLTAYTYETPMIGGKRAINGIILTPQGEGLIDTFSYERLQEDLFEVKGRIDTLKERGAEVIVTYIHWGHEYHHKPSSYQREIAQELVNYGVHIIFGSHPHVIQPIDIIKSDIEDHEAVVVYSMGNFLSNQRLETLSNSRTEDGVIVNVTISKDLLTNEISISRLTYTPTWVHRYYRKGRPVYEILPLPEAILRAEDYTLTQREISRLMASREATKNLVESEGIIISITNVISKEIGKLEAY